MYTIIFELLKRHFQSEGFKDRLQHIYLPYLKMGVVYLWNVYYRHKETKHFTEIYAKNEPVIFDKDMVVGASTAPVVGTGALPLYETIANRLKSIWLISEEQGTTSQCVAFTFNNIHRYITKLIGWGDMKVSQLDIYIDRVNKKYDGEESGMSPADTYPKLANKGVAVGDVLPLITDQSLMKAVDNRKYFPDEKIQPYRIKLLKTYEWVTPDWASMMSAIRSVPMGYPLQAVTGVTDTYFASDVVYAKYNTFYAGHSITVIGGSACIVDGQEGFFITDSAYFKNRVYRFGTGIRFITKDFWTKMGYGMYKPIFVDEIANQIKPATAFNAVFVYDTCAFGQGNSIVRNLQNALIGLGFNLKAGATGYYGQQTADAVLAFQLQYQKEFEKINPTYTVDFLKSLGGKTFGNDSIKVINSIQGL